MGQIVHGSARTTAIIRRTIQRAKLTKKALSHKYSINAKTVSKWRTRSDGHDAPMRPRQPCSTVLSREEEVMCLAFRKPTLLPLDDCLYSLQETIPHLTRSSLHRLFQRHGISRLPQLDHKKPGKKKFRIYPIGYFHRDSAAVHTKEGRLYLFVAIDRTSTVTFVELHEKATRRLAATFLRTLVKAVPYTIHTVRTENGAAMYRACQISQKLQPARVA